MSDKVRNVIIIGSGPAGLTAGLYTARANLAPILFAGSKWGGQLMLTTDVENYPGFSEGILGPELMKKFRDGAEKFGTEIVDEDVTSVDFKTRPFKIAASGKTYSAKSVIIATGAETNWLGLANEQRLIGRGISSCAPCDAFFFRDKKVIVVGGGDSAMEEALVLTKFATEVIIVHRRNEFRASQIMQDRVKKHPKIHIIYNAEVIDVLGEEHIAGVRLKMTPSDQTLMSKSIDELEKITPSLLKAKILEKQGKSVIAEMPIDGIFVAIGHHPVTDFLKGQVDLDEKGYVKRIPKGDSPTSMQMTTSVEGVFVAGDVHDLHYKQAITAAGYGCSAALEAERWLESQE